MDRAFLGLDLGTSSVKAVLVDHEGVTRAESSAPLALQQPEPGAAEQDAFDWWMAAEEAIRALEAEAHGLAIEAIGLTGQKHALLALDGDLEPLDRAWLWADVRARPEGDELPGTLLPKWRLWARRHPDRAGRTRHLCFAKDWLRFRLTGVLATDRTEASTLPPGHDLPLPPVHASAAITGHTPDGVPVVAGAGDNEAAALASGVVEAGIVGIVLGTSGTVVAEVATDTVPPGLVLGASAFRRGALATGVVMATGRALTWVKDLAFPPGTTIDQVVQAATDLPEDVRIPLFLPSLEGERSPVPDPGARGAFAGLEASMGAPHLARAVLEGTALALGQTVDLLRRAGVEVRELRLTSGGARSPLWCRLVGAACEAPLRVVGLDGGPARGAAMLAAGREGGDEALRDLALRWTEMSALSEPLPSDIERLRVRSRALERLRLALKA